MIYAHLLAGLRIGATIVPSATPIRAPRCAVPPMKAYYALLLFLMTIGCAHAAGDGLERLPGSSRPGRYELSIAPNEEFSEFNATVRIDFDVLRATRQIHLNERDLTVHSAVLASGVAAQLRSNPQHEQIVLEFRDPLPKGRHTITLNYSGHITDNVDGLFRVDYPTPAGSQRMLFTRLCCINSARLMVPSWDEPAFKAVFELELVVPPKLQAVSNMPIVMRLPLADGRSRVKFAPTPRMSSYLLFFAVGAFDRITRTVGTTELGIVAPTGKAERGRFALAASATVLNYYQDYFGIPFPLPKLDNVAMPGAGAFGAMENWGSIFYFEPRLLLDPELSTEQARIGIYTIVAHETAHQWFGNLVTAQWWDDIWLNEAFASWMEAKATDRFNPLWNIPLHVAEDREEALRLDALPGTHPIVRPLHSIGQALVAFDTITYNKGSQVVQMIEGWTGEEEFRSAIGAYLRDHAYANATTADLWRALDASSTVPVSAIARDFTRQEGVPLIDVLATHCIEGTNTTRITVRQGRFTLDAGKVPQLQWHVPVTAFVIGSAPVARQIVHGARPVTFYVPGCGPVKINRGERAYFRTRYDSSSFNELSRHFQQLPAVDQLGLLNDAYSLAEGEYASFARYLDLVYRLGPDADPLLLRQFVTAIEALYRLSDGLDSQATIAQFARQTFAPLLARIGWTPQLTEPANTDALRAALIALLARTGDAPTFAEAERRLRASENDSAPLPGNLRKAIVETVGASADTRTFEEFAARARATTDSNEQRLYLVALAKANDPVIARRTLDLALDGTVPAPFLPPLFLQVANRHPRLTYDFVTSHFSTLSPRLEASERTTLVPQIASAGNDRATADALLVFARGHFAAHERESVVRARGILLYRDRLRRDGLPQITSWIANHGRPQLADR